MVQAETTGQLAAYEAQAGAPPGDDSWPRRLSLALACVPPAVLAVIVVGLLLTSIAAVRKAGIVGLLSATPTSVGGVRSGEFGLLPALVGTMQIAIVSMMAALPVSAAIAMLAVEFPLGPLGPALEAMLGAFSGIPPIIYALASAVLVQAVLIPKFCGPGLTLDQARAVTGRSDFLDTMLPKEGSVLLGGIFLSLLLVPFITPLIADACRNVPLELRQASWALGVNRWDTVKRVVLPQAVPGLSAAAALGLLKATGDMVICAWAISFESSMPSPIWDVFEHGAPMPVLGASLAGAYTSSEGQTALTLSTAAVCGVLLLLFAGVVLALQGLTQYVVRRRLGYGHGH